MCRSPRACKRISVASVAPLLCSAQIDGYGIQRGRWARRYIARIICSPYCRKRRGMLCIDGLSRPGYRIA